MNSAATVPAPEDAITFADYFNQNTGLGTEYDNLFIKAATSLSGTRKRLEDSYQTYLNNLHNRNEAKAVQSARAWDEYMANTAYSRAFKDLERVGVNPYLLLNSGSSPATSVGSASKPSYQYSKTGIDSSKSNSKGRDLALIMLAIAKIASVL